jgi:hypothetical protein
MQTSSLNFDDLRREWPSFGFAVYAYAPGGAVTVEAIIQDEAISVTGATLDEALQRMASLLRPTEPDLFEPASAPIWTDPGPENGPADTPDIFG